MGVTVISLMLFLQGCTIALEAIFCLFLNSPETVSRVEVLRVL